MGANWTHSYNIFLTFTAGTGTVAITQGDGHQDFYTPAGGGAYTAQTLGLFNTLVQNADTSFTLTFKNQTKFNFSATGQLLTVVDRNGNTQSLSYSNGTLTSVTDTSGRAFTFSYDGNGRLVALTDPSGRTLHYAYDGNANLISYQDALGNTTQYAYDAAHRMTSATDPRGNVYMQNVYDASSPARVIRQTNARGFVTTFAYNTPATGITTETDPVGNSTEYVYDAGLRLVSIVDANSGVTENTYDGNNLKLSDTDALGNKHIYTYDAVGNLLASADPLGSVTAYTYDARNDLLSVTDPLSHKTSFTYDSKSNLLTSQDASGGVTTNTYDASGQVLTTTNARTFTTTFQYDAYGDRTQATDALSGITQSTFDSVGHLLTTKNQLGNIWTRTYDADDRLLTASDPLGNRTAYAYDANGNRTQVTDANGHVTANGYDVNNNLTQVTDAAGGVTAYSYNGNDDQIGITDANSHTTLLVYDSLRRLASRTDPLGRAQTYAYDAAGNLVGTVDGNGKTNTFAYDALNRRVGAVLSDGKTVGYTYDAVGNRLTMTDWRGTTNYVYDSLNRVTSVAQPGGTVGYSYDAVGKRASINYADGKTVTYTYDGLNRLTKTTDWLSQVTVSGYDAAGNLTSTALPNGASSIYTYDAARRLVSLMNFSGVKINSGYTYVLDNVGNRVEVASQNEGVQRYGYDKLYRLISWTSPSRQETRYAYDGVGNRMSLVAPTGKVNYTYDVADQLLTSTDSNFAYDNNGNRVLKSAGGTTLTYGWDALNRLTSVEGGSANTQYQYDGDGNRVSQQTSAGTYTYLNDTATALPVVLNENGPDGSISYAFGSSLVSASATGFQSFYQFDGLGSTSDVTDQSASQKANYTYDPWGVITGTVDLLAEKNKYRYAGEALDPGVNLVFLRARYYDPGFGRFLSKDGLDPDRENPRTINRYTYVFSSPLTHVDPTGFVVEPSTSVGKGAWAWLGQSGFIPETWLKYLAATTDYPFTAGFGSEIAGPVLSIPGVLQQNADLQQRANLGQISVESAQTRKIINFLEIGASPVSSVAIATVNAQSGGQFNKSVESGIDAMTYQGFNVVQMNDACANHQVPQSACGRFGGW